MADVTAPKQTAEKSSRVGTLKLRVHKPKVAKADRAASVHASKVRTDASVDFVKATRGR